MHSYCSLFTTYYALFMEAKNNNDLSTYVEIHQDGVIDVKYTSPEDQDKATTGLKPLEARTRTTQMITVL